MALSQWNRGYATLLLLFPIIAGVGGRAEPLLGVFLYPDDSAPTFNYKDSVNATWETHATNFTSPNLYLWVQVELTDTRQTLGRLFLSMGQMVVRLTRPVFNASVPSSGSLVVPLDYGSAFAFANFVLQQGPLNNANSSFYVGGHFGIRDDPSIAVTTWSLQVATAPSPTSIPTSTDWSTALVASNLPTGSSNSSGSSIILSSGAIIAIAFSVVAVVLGMAILVCLLIRKSRRLRAVEQAHYRARPPLGNSTWAYSETGRLTNQKPSAGRGHGRAAHELPAQKDAGGARIPSTRKACERRVEKDKGRGKAWPSPVGKRKAGDEGEMMSRPRAPSHGELYGGFIGFELSAGSERHLPIAPAAVQVMQPRF
jgi:hypothetical protein